MEYLRRLIRKEISEVIRPRTIEESLIGIPQFPANSLLNKFTPEKRDAIWLDWAKNFVFLHESTDKDSEQKAVEYTTTLTPLELIHLTQAVYKTNSFNFIHKLAANLMRKQLQNELSINNQHFLSQLKLESTIPPEFKKEFPKLPNKKADIFRKIARNTTSTIVLERIISDGSERENFELLLINLRKIKSGKIAPPTDPNFTNQILENYGQNRKIRKILNKIHNRFPDWSKDQSK